MVVVALKACGTSMLRPAPRQSQERCSAHEKEAGAHAERSRAPTGEGSVLFDRPDEADRLADATSSRQQGSQRGIFDASGGGWSGLLTVAPSTVVDGGRR